LPLPPDIQPLRESGVIQGSSVAAASGAVVVAENLPVVVNQLERADGHLQAGTIFGLVIGLLIIAGAGWALWQRIRAARELRDGVAR
jgi:hypothetical protein